MHEGLTPEVASAAIDAKMLAHSNRTKRNYILLGGVLLALASLALFAWATRNEVGALGFLLSVALGVLGAYAFLLRFGAKLTPVEAKCPRCGWSWEIKEGRHVPESERMSNWNSCPGCSLPMRNELLKRIAVGARQQ